MQEAGARRLLGERTVDYGLAANDCVKGKAFGAQARCLRTKRQSGASDGASLGGQRCA